MKKKVYLSVILVGLIALIFIFLYFYRFSTWKSGNMGPKQFYKEVFHAKKVSTTEVINGIEYSFDDIGNCIQNEVEGEWIKDKSSSDIRYQLKSGVMVKHTWYYIDGHWYYFDKNGILLRDRFFVKNGKKYHLDREGRMETGEVIVNGELYFTYSDGVIEQNTFVPLNGIYYYADHWGRVTGDGTTTIETVGNPLVMIDDNLYHRYKPVYFFRSDYTFCNLVVPSGGLPTKNGEGYGFYGNAEIYRSKSQPDSIFVYERHKKQFYSYTLSPMPDIDVF